MITLLTIHDSDIFPGTVDADPSHFSLRHAARAILLDEAGRVALLNVGTRGYHKLPGGGVEEGEDMQVALERELLEEVGAHPEIIREVGGVVEYKNEHQEKQISHCWLARVVGEIVPPTFTDEEQQQGFGVEWAADIEDAIRIVAGDEPQNYSGKFIQKRDLKLLEAAREPKPQI